MTALFNIAARRVGGLTFVKIGRLTFSFSVSSRFRPFKAADVPALWPARDAQLARAFELAEHVGHVMARDIAARRESGAC